MAPSPMSPTTLPPCSTHASSVSAGRAAGAGLGPGGVASPRGADTSSDTGAGSSAGGGLELLAHAAEPRTKAGTNNQPAALDMRPLCIGAVGLTSQHRASDDGLAEAPSAS